MFTQSPITEPVNEGYCWYESWLKNKCPHGFINSWGWKNDCIDHLDSFRLSFFNSTNKTIKSLKTYINFSDKDNFYIKPTLGKGYDIELTYNDIIKPMEIGEAQWDLTNTFIFNAESCTISKIIINYTDGTKYVLIKEIKINSGTF